MSQANRIIRLCNRCIRREKEKYNATIHRECVETRLTRWDCNYYFCKIQDRYRIGRHTYPIDVLGYNEQYTHESVQFSGRCFWQKNTPREGHIAILPVYLIEYSPKDRTISMVTSILTDNQSGSFSLTGLNSQGEYYLAFKMDDINISICQRRGVVTGHECQLCFQNQVKSTREFAHQIRCRKANIIQEHSFEFVESRQLYRKIHPIFN